MAFTRSDFTLHFSLPLDQVDWQNLRLSRVSAVMLAGIAATQEVVQRLRNEGINHITVRLSNDDVWSADKRKAWADELARLRVEAVVLGTEPDNAYDLRYGHPWGEASAFARVTDIHQAHLEIKEKAPHIQTVSPALTYRGHYRDWREGVQPGRYTWLEILRLSLDECDLCGLHLYGADGTTFDMSERMR